MVKLTPAAVAATAVIMAAGAASATTIADFELNGNLTNSAGGTITLTDNSGGGLGATGITFGANGGPTLNNLGTLSVYTLETRFDFSTVSGYRKIADFFNKSSDTGLYVLNGDINFFDEAFGSGAVVAPGQLVTVDLTRNGSGLVTGYVNGVSQFSFTDSTGLAVINGTLNLFQDDANTSFNEASPGFVDYIKLSDVGGFSGGGGGVPEPAAWAMMVLGVGAIGAALRMRTKTQGAAAA
jgi:hypothetical protein